MFLHYLLVRQEWVVGIVIKHTSCVFDNWSFPKYFLSHSNGFSIPKKTILPPFGQLLILKRRLYDMIERFIRGSKLVLKVVAILPQNRIAILNKGSIIIITTQKPLTFGWEYWWFNRQVSHTRIKIDWNTRGFGKLQCRFSLFIGKRSLTLQASI